ncbi:MAG: hypothetical protein JWP81_2565 [Ferruginibacter sp.]|nr:hypothetical protein [Ferruginibacter sp.]
MIGNKNKYGNRLANYLLILFVIGTTSCTKNFDTLNTPPDKIVADNVGASLIGQAFAQCQYEGMYGHAYEWQQAQNLYADLYAQYFATTVDYFDSDQHLEIKSWSSVAWNRFYSTAAPQLYFVENLTKKNNMAIENAIVKIWSVQLYHRITDYWGPIIYSQFGNGKTSVSYDAQDAIYKDFIKKLDEAVAVLQQSTGNSGAFATSDLVYGGNVKKWLTFANSLRLRLAMRMVYVEPDLAKLEAEKAVAAGVMLNNADNAAVTTTLISRNPISEVIGWGEFRMSATMQSTLTGFNDPRLSVFFSPVSGGGYKGMRNGLPRTERANASNLFSNLGSMYFDVVNGGTNPAIRVMSASEVYFLRAEGALRGWQMGGTADQLYNDGIKTSLKERTKVSDAEINAYISSSNKPGAVNDKWNTPAMSDIPVAYQSAAGFEKRLEQIITQKWIALYPDGWEAWAERRRTGYPVGFPIVESLNPGVPVDKQMRRLTFTVGELTNNSEAVKAALNLLGGADVNETKLWWDKKN